MFSTTFANTNLLHILIVLCSIHFQTKAFASTTNRSIFDNFQYYPSQYDVPDQFPKRFLFGSATSSYQIEGAWNKDGKTPSIWDTLTHNHPEHIADKSNGNVACNSYEFYEKDIAAIKEIGMNFYRFSLSWPRILPYGDISKINEVGLQYYDKIINNLLENHIIPMVTMYHWDLPQRLQDFGGWMNPLIVDYMVEYARVLFDRYGNRVKIWYTFNEPRAFCFQGYGNARHAPKMITRGVGEYLCAHHVLLAHAKIYHMYRENYVSLGGSIGLALDSKFSWPKDPNNANDVAAAKRAVEFKLGWFAHPIFSKDGDYPDIMREIVDKNSADEGLPWSRLPRFTEEEKKLIKGSADFFGLNYYTSFYGREYPDLGIFPHPSLEKDQNAQEFADPIWPVAASTWLYSVPDGLRELLNWIKIYYNNPEIIIAENGWSNNDKDGLNDVSRINYISGHLQAVLNAIWKDDCRVVAYTYWSLLDNFEWTAGYTERFGLFHVNFTDPEKKRTAKKSALFMSDIIQSRQLP